MSNYSLCDNSWLTVILHYIMSHYAIYYMATYFINHRTETVGSLDEWSVI